MDLPSAARVAAAFSAPNFKARSACIVASGIFGGSRCLLKNRDRNYKPELRAYHEIREGVEVLYIKDEITGWLEGVNSFGLGAVNSALMVNQDEAEKKLVRTKGKKSEDGERILKLLEQKSLEDAIKTACTYKGGIKGHTFVSSAYKTVSIEQTSKHECVQKPVSSGKVQVRTNHGLSHSGAGYTDGADYQSSMSRFEQAQGVLSGVTNPEDIAPSVYRERKGDNSDPDNMVRDTENMRTTSQLVLDLTKKQALLYLIPGKAVYLGCKVDLPEGFAPTLSLKVFEYTKDLEAAPLEKIGCAEPSSARVAAAFRTATKTKSEKDDEEAERLIQPAPQKKPPRGDLARKRVQDVDSREDSSEAKQEEKDNPKPSKASASRVALLFTMTASVEETKGGKFKGTRPDKTVEYFDSKEEAQAWVSNKGSDAPPAEAKKPSDQITSDIRKEFEGKAPQEAIETAISMMDEDGSNADVVRTLLDEHVKDAESAGKRKLKEDRAKAKKEKAKEEAKQKQELADPLFDKEDPIPDSSEPDEGERSQAHRDALTERTLKAVDRWLDLDASERSEKSKIVADEIKDLEDGDVRKDHLEAVLRGIQIGGVITHAGKAEGVGSAAATLIKAAHKGGFLRNIAELGVIGSKKSGTPDDQAIVRKIYEDLPSDEWVGVLPEGHPGRDLAELLASPEEGKFLTPADRLEISTMLVDMQVAEVNFIDPAVSRTLSPQATSVEHAESAKAQRLKVLPQPIQRPKDRKGLTKALGGLKDALKALIRSSTRGEAKHKPGDVWPQNGKFWGAAQNGAIQGFDLQSEAQDFAKSTPSQ